MSIEGFPANETFREKMQKKLVAFRKTFSRKFHEMSVVSLSFLNLFIFCVNQQLGSRINTPFENETCILKKSCFLFELFPFFKIFAFFREVFQKKCFKTIIIP